MKIDRLTADRAISLGLEHLTLVASSLSGRDRETRAREYAEILQLPYDRNYTPDFAYLRSLPTSQLARMVEHNLQQPGWSAREETVAISYVVYERTCHIPSRLSHAQIEEYADISVRLANLVNAGYFAPTADYFSRLTERIVVAWQEVDNSKASLTASLRRALRFVWGLTGEEKLIQWAMSNKGPSPALPARGGRCGR